jgi:hypothetical protein
MTIVAQELRKILGTKEVAAQSPESELGEIEACACNHIALAGHYPPRMVNCREQAFTLKTPSRGVNE